MAQLLVGIVVFVVVFVLKLIFGAAGGALQAVESVRRDNDFERYTGYSERENNSNALIGHTSDADKIREYRELYEDDIISYDEFEAMKKRILNGY